MNDVPRLLESELELTDGRTLCYAEFGDETGVPVMLFHGAPGYRRFWTALPQYPFQPGLRLIAPDRPGYGRSDFKAGMTFVDWPDDVVALADHLGLDRFAVAGVSGGGLGTLACAWRIPERLSYVAVVASPGPLTPEVLQEMSRVSRNAYKVARSVPGLMRLNMKLLAAMQRRNIDSYLDKMSGKMSGSDKAALARPEVRSALREAMSPEAVPKDARGYAQDVIDQSRPWPIALSEIRVPVNVWQSEEDTSVPTAVGRHFAAEIPDCVLNLVPNAGHLWHIEQFATVLDAVLAATRQPGEGG